MTPGFHHIPGFLDGYEVDLLIKAAREIGHAAPFRHPTMPDGTPLKVKVTNAGAWGWWSDNKGGYRYVDKHPTTGRPWPAIPPEMLWLCARALNKVGLPQMQVENLLINFYGEDASLGMHVDRTEDDQEAPIVSFSVGADALFMLGGLERGGKQTAHVLQTGDLVVQSGESRNAFHGIKKLLPTMTNPIKSGRLNFTFRKVRR